MSGGSEKILVIDDETRMCDSLYELFSNSGYDVTTTKSSTNAINQIKKNKYDLIITDIKMPEYSGLDILKTAKDGLSS